MGDPRKTRRKYDHPRHPWQKERIDAEKVLLKEYGLKNKSEIWKITTAIKNYGNQAKKLIAARGEQADKEKAQLIAKLASLGLIPSEAHLDDVLGIDVKQLLDRRLQSVLVAKGFARTTKQARQFITHGHVLIRHKKIISPSHLVRMVEEDFITFNPRSELSKDEHPERVREVLVQEKPVSEKRKGEVVTV